MLGIFRSVKNQKNKEIGLMVKLVNIINWVTYKKMANMSSEWATPKSKTGSYPSQIIA